MTDVRVYTVHTLSLLILVATTQCFIDTFHMQEEVASFGIDWNGPLPTDEDVEIVQVVLTRNPLDEIDYTELQQTIDPCQFSPNYGVDLYLATLNFVSHKIQQTVVNSCRYN